MLIHCGRVFVFLLFCLAVAVGVWDGGLDIDVDADHSSSGRRHSATSYQNVAGSGGYENVTGSDDLVRGYVHPRPY